MYYFPKQDKIKSAIAFVVSLGRLPAAKSINGPSWVSLAILTVTPLSLVLFSTSSNCCM